MGSMMTSGLQLRNLVLSIGIASLAVAAIRIKPKRARAFAR
jgi:hypothetical protein